MFLQVMFVLESLSTLAAFELAASGLVEQRQLQREKIGAQSQKEALAAAGQTPPTDGRLF